MYSIVEALMKLANELAIDFHFNTAIEEIIIQNDHVTGIRVDSQFCPSDVVVSDGDNKHTYP